MLRSRDDSALPGTTHSQVTGDASFAHAVNFDSASGDEEVLENVKAGKKALIVMAEKDENVIKSAANIPGVRTALVGTMNVYEIINHESFIVTQEAVKKIEEVYA